MRSSLYILSDEELLQQLKAGNEDAFEEIFKRYRVRLFLEAERKLNNEADAQDITQEIFISLWKNHSKIEIQSSLKHYLLQTVRYKAIDLIRSRAINEKRQQQYTYIKDSIVYTNSTMETHELGNQLQAAINGMTPIRRDVFRMGYIERKPQKEIAILMGISVLTVKKHISNALRTLREKLKE